MKTIFLSLSSGKRIDCIILVRNSRKSFVAEKSQPLGTMMYQRENKKQKSTDMETTRLNSNVQRIFNDLLQQDLISRYQLLERLQSDCEYFLNWGDGSIGRLWTGSVELQIELMKQIHDSFKEEEKPQWLTMEQIMEYGRRMKQ